MTTAPPPGTHGGRGHLHGVDLDLSASLNPVAPDPTPIFARHLDVVSDYPDDARATAALADVLDIEPERLVVTNGGAEAIALVANEVRSGWVAGPEFSLYERHLTIDPNAGRWCSDPNNPTGALADADDVALVRDEAFYPLATARWTRGDTDCWTLGSLTKVFACPGVRMGYVIAPDDAAAAAIRHRRPRWSVSGLGCAAIPDLLATAELPTWVEQIRELRSTLASALTENGWHAEPGAANYLWIPDAPGLRDAMFRNGILLRSGASFGHPDAVRIAVPTPDRLADVIGAIPSRDQVRPSE